VAPGGSWWLLVAPGGSWWLLVAPGGSWWQLTGVICANTRIWVSFSTNATSSYLFTPMG
jgi:hypothetical protein